MSIITVYKNGQSQRLHEIDAGAWFAQGWSLDPNFKAPEPEQSESATNPNPVADLEQPSQPEPEKPIDKPEPKRKPAAKS